MKWLLGLLVVGMTFAALKVLLIALVLALLVALVTCFIVHPKGTLMLLGGMGLLGLANTQPLACIITLGIVGIVAVLDRPRREPRSRTLLPEASEHHSN